MILALSCLSLFVGCSTQSDKWLNVHYHNLTCHYNVWWNGNESLKSGIQSLEQSAGDDYTRILPVYQLGTKEQALKVKPQMDKAIEKGIKGLKKHSIYLKGKEYVDYVKNCYLLTAYATFYEQDYAATDNTCRLIISQYSGTKESDEAKILLARSLTCQKLYIDAETALDQLVNEYSAGNIHKSLSDKLFMAMVECTIPQEKYKKAVQYLRLSIDEVSNHYTKARLYYIMAQVYQTLDKRTTASKYFEKVIQCRPNYVMEFNARINIASCADISHTNVAQLEKDLDKLLHDKKNEEFKDQIYYAKGDMYLGVKDAQKACDNYKLSVKHAASKSPQKAKSALRLADVLYDIYENYDDAQSYYDTAMHIIDIEYPHYDQIRDRYNLLTSLVEFTRVIYLNDSLMTWADMDPIERNKLIQEKISTLRQKEEEEREQQLLAELKAESQSQNNALQGDWYFYNTNSVNKGKETFRQKWGNRTLEDYWFLSKKGVLGMGLSLVGLDSFENDTIAENQTDSISPSKEPTTIKDDPTDPHCVSYYLKDLPTRVSQRDSMHADIARCLVNAGYIYYDGIKNTERALECYLRMAKDYPDNQYVVQAFYQLYRIYSNQGNTPSANYYRDMVLMGFPDSDYANLIRDENYYLEIIERAAQIQNEYAEVFKLFNKHRYNDVLTHVDKVLMTYPDNIIMNGKFMFWKGMSYIQLNERDLADSTFRHIIAIYPDTAIIVTLAKEQLAYMEKVTENNRNEELITAADEARARGGSYINSVNNTTSNNSSITTNTTNTEEDELPIESQVFRYRESMQHYVVILVNEKKIVGNQLQYRVGDFNMANYSNSGYRCSAPMLFNDSIQLLTIHKFPDASKAMDYYTHILMPEGPFQQYNPKDFTIFAISTQNYSTLFSRKNIEAYMTFFKKFYLSDK